MELTTEQALQNLSVACAKFVGNLDEHKAVQVSLAKVREALEKKEAAVAKKAAAKEQK